MAGQGVGFHEVARRHGDFAIIAVAAAVGKDKAIRVGVGGMAGKPMVRNVDGNAAEVIGAFVGEWADELEGYEDLHASAALRRDLFKQARAACDCRGRKMIEEARTCAA